eukprot:CAMPEP_0176308304 /NCGR_PEP_ID=MMETSP0121_2-20121125/64476_1 /TAXON_ID=160619 /ORGANISM="Kryptoperidinium foliaceum, Strain CCMP 1326" /LENGTH=42 /DNA_ID= /DNA_START= /DNA_END= /DNA_ORIENTATION=
MNFGAALHPTVRRTAGAPPRRARLRRALAARACARAVAGEPR